MVAVEVVLLRVQLSRHRPHRVVAVAVEVEVQVKVLFLLFLFSLMRERGWKVAFNSHEVVRRRDAGWRMVQCTTHG